MLTTKTHQELLRMAREGMYDRDIAEALGVSNNIVSYYRKQAGILRGRGCAFHTVYQLYDRAGNYLFEGNVQQCAEFLGVHEDTIRQYISRFRAGKRTPVEIHAEPTNTPMRRKNHGRCAKM